MARMMTAAAGAAALEQPYPLPPCAPGASTEPPIVQHAGDSGPGRITEPGEVIAAGAAIFMNLTVRGNIEQGMAEIKTLLCAE